MSHLELAAGFGAADITPQPGIALSGFIFRENQPSTGVDDPLAVHVLALRHEGLTYLLISLEVLAISAELETLLLDALAAALGPIVARAHILLTATHTHSAPPTSPLEGERAPDPACWRLLGERTAQAALQAVQGLQPATLWAASYRIPGHTINRRALLADGRVSMALAPDGFVLERGPVDDTLTALVFRNGTGKTIGAVLHFACHGTTVCTQQIGGDVPGALARRVAELVGGPCLYVQGATGDVGPLAVSAGRAEMLAWLAPFLAHLDPLPDRLMPLEGAPVRLASNDVYLDYQPLPPRTVTLRRIADFDRIAQGDVESPDLQETIRLLGNLMNITPGQRPDVRKAAFASLALANAERRVLAAIDAGTSPRPCRARVSLLRVGSIALACVSAEVFAITGFRIRALSRGFGVLPVSYAAPIVGYVPDRDSLAKGGYEVDDAWRFYRHPAPFAPDSEDRIVATVRTLIGQM